MRVGSSKETEEQKENIYNGEASAPGHSGFSSRFPRNLSISFWISYSSGSVHSLTERCIARVLITSVFSGSLSSFGKPLLTRQLASDYLVSEFVALERFRVGLELRVLIELNQRRENQFSARIRRREQ